MGELQFEYEANRRGPKGKQGERGLPGTNAVANDEAFSTYLSEPDTETYAAMRAGVRELSSSVNVRSFGAIGDGITSDSVAVAAAISAAQTLGISTVVFDAGGTYRLTQPIQNGSRSLRIDATDAVILSDHSGSVVEAFGEFGAPVAVSAVTQTTRTNAVDGGVQNVVKLTVPAGLGWGVGDVAQIAADDVIPGSRDSGSASTSQNRVGAFLTVIEQIGTDLYCAGTLPDPYTTNVRIAKLDTSIAFSWQGGSIEFTDTVFANHSPNVFALMRLFAPLIDGVTIPRVRRCGVYVRNSLRWAVSNSRFMYGTNDLSVAAYGYGILNEGSAAGTVDSCFFTMLRHGYTNGAGFREPGGTGVDGYGRPTGTKIVNCVADSCTSAPYDSHSQGMHETFISCTAINSPAAFGLRGIEHRIEDAQAKDCAVVFSIFTEGVGGLSYGHIIDGLYANNCGRIVMQKLNYVVGHSSFDVRETRASTLLNVVSLNHRDRIAVLRNATLILANWRVQFAPQPNTNPVGLQMVNSFVSVRDGRINVRSLSDPVGQLIRFTFDGHAAPVSEADVQSVEIIGNGPTSMQYLISGGSVESARVRVRNVNATNPPTSGVTQYVYGSIPRSELTFG